MRIIHAAAALALLGACAPQIPDSGAGFDNSAEAQRAREAALANGTTINGDPLAPPGVLSSEALDPATGAPLSATGLPVPSDPGSPQATAIPGADQGAEDIARETAAALAAAGTGAAAPIVPDNPGISDENDFAAVSERRSIQDDAAQLERYKASYQEVAPTAVPERSGKSSPNIVSYALESTQPVGTRVYSRSGFNLEAKARRNCAKYASADQAQIAFLSAGGPERDRKGLDPDGDGFACGWDPTPFRKAAGN